MITIIKIKIKNIAQKGGLAKWMAIDENDGHVKVSIFCSSIHVQVINNSNLLLLSMVNFNA